MEKLLVYQCPVLLLMAVTMLSGVCVKAINYRLSVQNPVTLVTPSTVTRINETCCNPTDLSDCTFCPDDSRISFRVLVCFREGYHVGMSDENDCPLGGVSFVPNRPPGSVSALTPRVEATSLPAEYQGSLQLFGKITATSNNQETDLDIVWVFREEISADGVFRRICSLSQKKIAILCVNVRVACIPGTVFPNCSVSPTSHTTMTGNTIAPAVTPTSGSTVTSETTANDLTIPTVNELTTKPTTPRSLASTESSTSADTMVVGQFVESSSSISGVSIVIGLAIGAVIGTAVTVLTFSGILIACRRRRQKIRNAKCAPSRDAFEINANPTYVSTLNNPKDDPPLYQEIPLNLADTPETEDDEYI